jgi:Na+/melibiose symporter-like transporter
MSWIPALIVGLGALLMLFYPLNNERQTEVTNELIRRRAEANLKES